jgi:hypothetical protein
LLLVDVQPIPNMMDPAVAAALHGLPPGMHQAVPVQLHPHAHHIAIAHHHPMVHPDVENDEKILADVRLSCC